MTLSKQYLHSCNIQHLYILRDNRLFNIEWEMDEDNKDLNMINSLEFELRQILIEIKRRI
jgi:hypothetical protein